ncbi:hypothetical protein D3C81_441860 [compost metagenome]
MNLYRELWKTLFSAERMANRSAYDLGPSLAARKCKDKRMEKALEIATVGYDELASKRPGTWIYQLALKRRDKRQADPWAMPNCRCVAKPIIKTT